MENHKETAIAMLKVGGAWIGVLVGHAIDSITLSGLALVASTIYSAVQTYATLRRMRNERSIP